MRRRLPTLLVAVLAGAPSASVLAQCADTASVWYSVATVGSATDDRRRVAQDVGRCSTHGAMIRSTASMTERMDDGGPVRWTLVTPLFDATWNSALPFSMNDGAQWTGRGATSSITTGFRIETGPLSMSVVPQLVFEQNSVFEVLPSRPAGRSAFASPWHSGLESADLPLRFGNQSILAVYPGETWLELGAGPIAFGASSDGQWWGPGIRNALVMSNNAAGVPQGYIRTQRPIATPIGDLEFRWMLGGLTESLFFDTVATNNFRSLSADAATLRLAIDTGLTLGVARSVYATTPSVRHIARHAFDVFDKWNQVADTLGPAPVDSTDQILSVFARWVFPSSGLEVYGEWAKLFAPGIRELLIAPQSHQGYTLGLQWVNPLSESRAFRLQGEVTMLEQTPPSSRATTPSFYTSRLVPQGYTQLGQVIGAAIGPGSSSQFVAGDYLGRTWHAGLELNRIRWEDDAYYQSPNGVSFLAHDVSVIGGIRGGVSAGGTDFDLEMLAAKRFNYLFQSAVGGYAADRAFDINNFTIRVRIAPR